MEGQNKFKIYVMSVKNKHKVGEEIEIWDLIESLFGLIRKMNKEKWESDIKRNIIENH